MDILGVWWKMVLVEFFRLVCLEIGVLDKARSDLAWVRVRSKVALAAGSSMQGKTSRAQWDSNWVVTISFSSPLYLYLEK